MLATAEHRVSAAPTETAQESKPALRRPVPSADTECSSSQTPKAPFAGRRVAFVPVFAR